MVDRRYHNRTGRVGRIYHGVRNKSLSELNGVNYQSSVRLRKSSDVALSGLGVVIFNLFRLPLLVNKSKDRTIRNDGR